MINKTFSEFSIMSALRLAAVALLLVASVRVILPFLGALTWAAIIAITAWPLHKRLSLRLGGRKRWAATIIVLGLLLVLALPITLMVATAVETLPSLRAATQDFSVNALPAAPQWLQNLPLVGSKLVQLWASIQNDLPGFFEKARPAINQAALWILGSGASVGFGLLEIVLAIVIAGLFLVNGDALWDGGELAMHKLGGDSADDLPEVIARTVRSVSVGVVGTALAQTLLCVIGLAIAGVPGALVLGFLCFVIAVAQLPTLLVWLPAAGWVFYTGNTGYGVFLLLWGFLLVNTIDNFLKPWLISQGAQMPLSVIFVGVIGGLLAWGMIGLFIGPTLLAVCLSLFRHWLRHGEHFDGEERPAGEA